MKSCCFGWETLFGSFKWKTEVIMNWFFFFLLRTSSCVYSHIGRGGFMSGPEHCYTGLMIKQNKNKGKKKLCVYELYSIHRNNLRMMTLFANSVYVAFSNLWNLDNLKLIQNESHKHQNYIGILPCHIFPLLPVIHYHYRKNFKYE